MNAVDYVILALWIALVLVNRAALLPLLVMCIFMFCFVNFDSGIVIYCITASAYFLFSSATITPNYLRAPLLAAGSAYWVGALDEFLYTNLAVSTVYYDVMPYLIITINAYIAAVLMNKGGLQHVGLTKRHPRLVNRRWLGL